VGKQAVLTGPRESLKPLLIGALTHHCEGMKPSRLSELRVVAPQILVFLLRINFDTMLNFCEIR